MCFSQICCTEKIRWLLPREMGRTNSVVNTGRPLQRWTHPPATLIRESQEVKDCLLGNCHENQPVAPTPRGGGKGRNSPIWESLGSQQSLLLTPSAGWSVSELGTGVPTKKPPCLLSPGQNWEEGQRNPTRLQDGKKSSKTLDFRLSLGKKEL